jgi:hypothetical protein
LLQVKLNPNLGGRVRAQTPVPGGGLWLPESSG